MKFNFRVTTPSADELNVQTAKLGVPGSRQVYKDRDIGKPVVMGPQGTFKIASPGDNPDGFIDSIDGGPTADLLVVGGVARARRGVRFEVEVEAAAEEVEGTDENGDPIIEEGGPTAINVLDYVVAGTNEGPGTRNPGKLGVMKVTENPSNWRIVSLASDLPATEDDGEGFPEKVVAVIERVK